MRFNPEEVVGKFTLISVNILVFCDQCVRVPTIIEELTASVAIDVYLPFAVRPQPNYRIIDYKTANATGLRLQGFMAVFDQDVSFSPSRAGSSPRSLGPVER